MCVGIVGKSKRYFSMGTYEAIAFNQWVNDHNPNESLLYRKGWWDYIEIVRRLAGKFDIDDRDIQVVSTYLLKTPPPCEELLMPVLRLNTPNIQFTIKYDFGVYPEAWTVSVKSSIGAASTTLGLFDPDRDLRTKTIPGFEEEWVYGPYSANPAQFSCDVQDEWDLACLFRLMLTGRASELECRP
jgi:hypothetical protein